MARLVVRREPRGGRRRFGVTVAGVATTVAVAGCSGGSGASGAGGDTRFVSRADSAVTILPADRRGQPVALSGTTLTGQRLDVAAMRGRPVVLNVWGSWCAPCRKEAPQLEAASLRLKKEGVPIVGINIRDYDKAPALAFDKTFGITYPSLYDPQGSLLLSLRGAVPASAIPTTLVLDAEGRIAARVTGATTTTTLVDLVHDVAAS